MQRASIGISPSHFVTRNAAFFTSSLAPFAALLPFSTLPRPLVNMNKPVRAKLVCVFMFLLTTGFNATGQTSKAMADLQWFSGRWSCDGKFETSQKAISADLFFEPAFENKWLLFHHDDRPPFSYHALSEWGWDEKASRYVSTVQDSAGGVRAFYSAGFSDSKLLWEGRALENPTAPGERFEFTKTGPNTFTVSYSFQKDGQWKKVDTSACTRKF